MLHIKYQSSAGKIYGLSPIQVVNPMFGNALAQLLYAETYFMNGAVPLGRVSTPGYTDRTEMRRAKRAWDALFQGINMANSVAFVSEGTTYQPISINPTDSQLLPAIESAARILASEIFRVPGHMLGHHDQSPGHGGQSIEVLERTFVVDCLQSYMDAIGEALTSLHPRGQYCVFDPAERTRASTAELAAAASQGVLAGWLPPNDARAWLGLDPIPGGDQLYLPPGAGHT